MYKRVLLAYDGSVEGRTALREGALLAKHFDAEVFLLSIVADNAGVQLAEGLYPGVVARESGAYQEVLDEGVERLKQLGLSRVVAVLEFGEPGRAIASFAKRMETELVVVGHGQRGALERFWTGSTGAYLLEHADCSLLIARDITADQMLDVEIAAG